MLPEINTIRGVHPGAVLERELRQRKIRKSRFALSIGVYPQILTAVTKGKRGINPALSIRLGRALQTDEAYFEVLQAHYDIAREAGLERKRMQKAPDLSIIRKGLFWDCDFDKLDWEINKSYILQRVLERGNHEEVTEILRFYGKPAMMDENS